MRLLSMMHERDCPANVNMASSHTKEKDIPKKRKSAVSNCVLIKGSLIPAFEDKFLMLEILVSFRP